MKKETRKRETVEEYPVYISKDGQEFLDEHECEVHEMILDGRAKTCPDCNGEKFRDVDISEPDWYPWMHPEGDGWIHRTEYKECPTCKGKGYLVKKTIWE